MRLLYLLVLFSLSGPLLSKEVNDWPEIVCGKYTVLLKMKYIEYCVDKTSLQNVTFLSMGSDEQSVVIFDGVDDLFISLNPAAISISGLNKKYGVSVHDFFIALYHNNHEIIKDLHKVKSAFDLNDNNSMLAFKKNNVFAFAIIGLNDEYDTLYINKMGSDIIYQITGEFDKHKLLTILSGIQYKKM